MLQTTVVTGGESLTADVAKIGGEIAGAVSEVNWAQPTWDLFIILFFVAIVFFYGIMLGRDRVVVILVSIYMALAVVSNVPVIGQLRETVDDGFATHRILAFIGIFALLFFLLSRSAVMRSFNSLGTGSLLQAMIFSFLHVGLLISVTLSFLPPEAIGGLANFTQGMFVSDFGRLFWITTPILGIVALKGNSQE